MMTMESKLRLLDGRDHPSGFWAEEFVVPYEHFKKAGYHIDVATIGGVPPTVDPTSLNTTIMSYTRPQGSPNKDEENAKHYRKVIDALPQLKKPMAVEDLTRDDVAGYT